MMATTSLLALFLFNILKKFDLSLFYCEYSPKHQARVCAILTLIVVGYGFYFSYYTIINHYHFATAVYDFGSYQNSFVNTLHGNFMKVSYMNYNGRLVFRDHCDFILLAYLPFFYLIPKAETLLTVQAFSIALAAIPLFLFCKDVLKSSFAALIIAAMFLLHPANHCANFYDLHQLSFLPLFIFGMFYFINKKNFFAFTITNFLVLSIKADMFVILLFLSVFIYLNNKKDLKYAVFCFLAGTLYGAAFYFFLSKWLLGSFFYHFKGLMTNENGGLSNVIKTLSVEPKLLVTTLLTPDRAFYCCQIFGPLLFVPLLRFKNIPLFIFGLAITLLATNPGFHKIHYQYVWYNIPFIFIGLIYFVRDMQVNRGYIIGQNKVIAFLFAALFATFVYSWQYGAVLNRDRFVGGYTEVNFDFSLQDQNRLIVFDKMIEKIPLEATITADTNLACHLGMHENLKVFAMDHRESEYLVLLDPERIHPQLLEYLESSRGYKVISRGGGFQILKK